MCQALSTLYALADSFDLHSNLIGKSCYYHHFTDEENKDTESQISLSRVHS